MKYAVLTAKHHDGFCLFDSQLTDYKSTNTRAGRDLVREYVEAFRAEGLKVGLYYSLIDWHHPGYPAYGDRIHPMRNNEAYKDQPRDFPGYLDYMHGQVTELLSNYGKIDIVWFDFSYDDLMGEAWRATELVEKMRTLQPDIIMDNRLGASGEGNDRFTTKNPEIFAGDFACPEQIIPPAGLVDEDQQSVPWEACITLNKHWGYCAADRDYKSPQQVVRALVECVSKMGICCSTWGQMPRARSPWRASRFWRRSVRGCNRTVRASTAAGWRICPSRNGDDIRRRETGSTRMSMSGGLTDQLQGIERQDQAGAPVGRRFGIEVGQVVGDDRLS